MSSVSSSKHLDKRVPALRFPEFEGEWETIKLSDFVDRVTRKNTNNQTNLPLTISSKDGLVDQITYFSKTVASKDMSGYYLLLNGEFAYNKSYSVGYDFGSIKRLDRYPMGALSTLYICFALKKFDSDFIKVYFDSLKWYREIYMIAAEGARNHGLLNVSTEDFFETLHTLPMNIAEQQKIAAFFTLLEKRITKQRELVEDLKLYKRGLLSKLFPKNGSNVPEYRFMGFTEPWGKKKAKDLCSISTGKSNTQDQDKNGIYPFFIRSDVPVRSNKYLYNCEAVITIGDGNIGKVFHYINGKFDLHQRCYKMSDFSDVFGKYFYYYFSTNFYDRAMKMTAKATVDSVRLEMISEMDIQKPNEISEQKKIATFLTFIDNFIALHQHKLTTLENLKTSLLQQMFI